MTKTTNILSVVWAAALLGISGIALAQSPGTAPATQAPQKQEAPSSGTMGKDSMSKDGVRSNLAQQGKEMDAPAKSQVQAPADTKSQMSQDKDGTKSGATVGAAGAGAVNLTTEQRSTIRSTVLTANAPRATNINFSISVGTVVPSSVRVVEVPDTIVRIRPAWKGYRYFVYNDEIIIVEPRALKIVAVLDV